METYTWKVIRILIGPIPLVLVLNYLLRETWIADSNETTPLTLATALGSLFLTTGLVGAFRLHRDRKRSNVPKRTFKLKLAWFGLAATLAALLTGGVIFLGRVFNVRNTESYRWTAMHLSVDEWSERTGVAGDDERARQSQRARDYILFVEMYHPGLCAERVDEAAVERVSRRLAELDRHNALHGAIEEYQRRLKGTRDRSEGVWLKNKPDLSWYLNTFTPVAEHLAAADMAYEDARLSESVASGTATSLRAFRFEFSDGRHDEASRGALRDLYREAEKRYAGTAERADPESAEGIKALLAHLRDTDVETMVVPVCFLPVEGLQGQEIERAIKQETGAKRVIPVSPAFTAELNVQRQGLVVRRMNQALRAVVGDLFELREAPPEKTRNQPRFLVRYKVVGTGAIYSSQSEEKLPMAERTLFVGIAMGFECSIQLPEGQAPLVDDPEAGHCFTLMAEPATSFSAGHEGQSLGAYAAAVYNTMASTAFDDFKNALVRTYGLGEPKEGE